jgi:hypothetical protein
MAVGRYIGIASGDGIRGLAELARLYVLFALGAGIMMQK